MKKYQKRNFFLQNIMDESYRLTKIYNYIDWFFGIRKLIATEGKIVKTGYFYRIIFFIITLCVMIIIVNRNIYSIYSETNDTSIILTALITLSYLVMVIAYFIMMIQNISFCPNETMKVFVLFSDLEKCLGTINRNHNITVLFQHVLIISFKLILSIIEINLWDINYLDIIPYHFLMLSFELEILHFIIEVNIVARYFEKLNNHLNFHLDGIPVNCLYDGILLKFWKSNCENLSGSNIDTKSLIFIVDKLANVIGSLNFCYGTKVINCAR